MMATEKIYCISLSFLDKVWLVRAYSHESAKRKLKDSLRRKSTKYLIDYVVAHEKDLEIKVLLDSYIDAVEIT